MKVIMLESYMNLGEAGDVVNVAPGYARNFLIPQKLASSATKANLKLAEDRARQLEAKKAKEREASKKTADQIKDMSITLKVKVSDDGKLFGSVTTKQLEEEFAKLGAKVDRRQIVLGRQIKMAGDYSILVKLVGGLKVNVPLKIISDAPKKEAVA